MEAATMKERPILFSGEMVRRILSGEKTVTRRVLKDQPDGPLCWWPGDDAWVPAGEYIVEDPALTDEDYYHRCPYGKPGDLLYVRETWALMVGNRHFDGSIERWRECWPDENIHYRADAVSPNLGRWRPSIHMPRWASRITLEVTDVRVERLQEISEEDALAEGAVQFDGNIVGPLRTYWTRANDDNPFDPQNNAYVGRGEARREFQRLWESINGNRYHTDEYGVRHRQPFAWADNPWCWVVSFRRIGGEAA